MKLSYEIPVRGVQITYITLQSDFKVGFADSSVHSRDHDSVGKVEPGLCVGTSDQIELFSSAA